MIFIQSNSDASRVQISRSSIYLKTLKSECGSYIDSYQLSYPKNSKLQMYRNRQWRRTFLINLLGNRPKIVGHPYVFQMSRCSCTSYLEPECLYNLRAPKVLTRLCLVSYKSIFMITTCLKKSNLRTGSDSVETAVLSVLDGLLTDADNNWVESPFVRDAPLDFQGGGRKFCQGVIFFFFFCRLTGVDFFFLVTFARVNFFSENFKKLSPWRQG